MPETEIDRGVLREIKNSKLNKDAYFKAKETFDLVYFMKLFYSLKGFTNRQKSLNIIILNSMSHKMDIVEG
jgi:hypothetical protein